MRKSLAINCSAVPCTRTVTWRHAFLGECVCNVLKSLQLTSGTVCASRAWGELAPAFTQ